MTSRRLMAFSNPVRLKLILCLAKGPKNVTELIGTCHLAQSAVSQHLMKLRTSGIVISERNGREVLYILRDKKAALISQSLLTYIQ